MDAIKHDALASLAKSYPFYAIRLSHQFNDGTDGNKCGFLPKNWNGKTLHFEKRAD